MFTIAPDPQIKKQEGIAMHVYNIAHEPEISETDLGGAVRNECKSQANIELRHRKREPLISLKA